MPPWCRPMGSSHFVLERAEPVEGPASCLAGSGAVLEVASAVVFAYADHDVDGGSYETI